MTSATRVKHTAITVRDLERAVACWEEWLDFETAGRQSVASEAVARLTGIEGQQATVVVLAAANAQIELVRYSPGMPPIGPNESMVAPSIPTAVIALTVTDMDAKVKGLQSCGWRQMGEVSVGPVSGNRLVYMRDSLEGTAVQLIELANQST